MQDLRHVRSRLWRRVSAFYITGVIQGVGGFLGRVFVLTGACLSKIKLWRRVSAFYITGVIQGVGGFLGRVFVLTGACLSKIKNRIILLT